MALAKFGTPTVVGQFSLGLAITVPVAMFFSMNLRVLQATDNQQGYAFGEYLGFRLATSFFFLPVLIGIILITGYQRETSLIDNRIANQLREAGIQCDTSFAPLHTLGPLRELFGYQPGDFPVAEELGRSSLALPFTITMTEERVDAICRVVRNAL